MTLITLIFAFLLEQVRPLSVDNFVFKAIVALAHWLEEAFNAGERQHGRSAWLLLVVPTVLGVWGVGMALGYVHPLLTFLWNIACLYFTLGFRQFSHYFTAIQLALHQGDLESARRVLTVWVQETDHHFAADTLDTSEIVRHTVRQALIASHRHVFGVLFWTMLLPGASGAVLYRLAEYLKRRWNLPQDLQGQRFGEFAQQAFALIDWIPIRLSALGFAIVGNFEDAIYCWRTQAHKWSVVHEPGILLASGGGALGVRLNPIIDLPPTNNLSEIEDDTIEGELNESSWQGATPEVATLQSAVGLVWRAVILWLIVLVLVSVGSWIR